MGPYMGRRLLHSVVVLIGITLVSFLLIHFVPGDPVRIMVSGRASPERIAEINRELGLDRPLPEQYGDFVAGLFRGDLGTSIVLRRSVGDLVGQRLGATLFLLTYATVIAVVLTLPLGILSAVRRNRLTDHSIRVITLFAFAMPSFWLALLLVREFSLNRGLFPVSGYGEGFAGHLHSLFLPAVTIGLFLASMLIRSLRGSLIDVLGMEYVEAARARGLSETRVVLGHGVRNALLPTITVLAVNIGFLLSGAVVIERVFDIPGLGSLLVESIFKRDFTTIQGLTLVFGVIVIAINLLSDLAYAVLDRRVRLS
jgi:peptide/nickel transport system permease protein